MRVKFIELYLKMIRIVLKVCKNIVKITYGGRTKPKIGKKYG